MTTAISIQCGRPTIARYDTGGFTLMETLVMLVLVSLSVLLMFQMLGSYRIVRERIVAQAGGIDRQTLFAGWFADSVGGLHAIEGQPLRGSATSFSAVTLNPLFASPGAPVRIEWMVEPEGDGIWSVRYVEAGELRWTLPLSGGKQPRFVYLDEVGAVRAAWPPDIGLQVELPSSVALLRGSDDDGRVQVALVRGPLQPVELPYQLEED